jgi:hypothetical protein
VQVNGELGTSGDVVADNQASSISLQTHIHTQPSDAAGDSESPTDAPQ